MIVRVEGNYNTEDEALIGLMCQAAFKKFQEIVGLIDGEGILKKYSRSGIGELFISNIENEQKKVKTLFDFEGEQNYNKKLIIITHSLIDYEKIMKSKLEINDIVLIKNYIPSYKDERSIYGPNVLKNYFKRKSKVFAIELDMRFQNYIFLGIENSYKNESYFKVNTVSMDQRLLLIYKNIILEEK